ncbi:MAG: efflux RND transporter permease subunit [Chthoniobacterales bacterium]
MNISEPFIRRPVATSLLMVGLVLLGCLGYYFLPVASLPGVDFPTIQVVTRYPGASPEVMTSAITTPLERQFGMISGLDSMNSTSSFGVSTITLQFILGRDIDVAAQDVQAAINAASGYLPKTLPDPPIYSKVNPADPPILTLAVTSASLPMSQVNDLVDTLLAQKLSQVTGVGLVSIEGNQKPAVRIQFNPTALASLGLSPETLRSVIDQGNINAPKGSFEGSKQSVLIGSNDQLLKANDYASMIVAYRGEAPVRLQDIATVEESVENNQVSAWVGKKPAVLLDIQRQPGANIIETVDRIKKMLPYLTAGLPPSVKVKVFIDRTERIRASVEDVQFTLLLTILLVVLVIFLFLRKLWATVIPSIALPLSLVGTFGIMSVVGFSLNNLTLMALTVSTGFVVDDAIVMLENIFRHLEAGESPLKAALVGSKQIGFTVISLSISLIAVFIPLLFMTGVVGRLFHEFAITLSAAVVVSAIVSLTLAPMMCGKFLRAHDEMPDGRFAIAMEKGFAAMSSFYDRTLRFVLHHKKMTLLAFAITFFLTFWLALIVPKGFLPEQDTGLILGVTEAAQSVSFSKMVELQQRVAELIKSDPDVKNVASFVGAGTVNATLNSGRLYIVLKPRSENLFLQFTEAINSFVVSVLGASRTLSSLSSCAPPAPCSSSASATVNTGFARKATAQEVITRLRAAVNNVIGISLFFQAVQDLQIDTRLSRTQYQYTIQDANAEELNYWVPRLKEKLSGIPGLIDVSSDQQAGGLQVSINVDRVKASRLGVQTDAIDNTLYDCFGQRPISTIFTDLNQFRVVMEVDERFRSSPDMLNHIFINSENGSQVPLSSFVSIKEVNAPLVIVHEDQFPAATISFNLVPGASLGEALKKIYCAQKELNLPDSIRTSFHGAVAEFKSSLSYEPYLVLAALIVIYIVLGMLYESYIHPLTILSTLPSAGLGALLALMVFHVDFSLIALIGIILLIGIVKKNAIMMIDFALEAQREKKWSPEKAIYQACILRFRPIMMTTMAALLGAIPLALQQGTGSELRRPLGITIVGGLLFSQILTLYTTPVIYLALDRVASFSRKRKEKQADGVSRD